MVDHFLQLGGVKNLKDFYKKFPTEAHFDQHMHQMKYGGGINAYDKGGPILPGTLSKGIADYQQSQAQQPGDDPFIGPKNYDQFVGPRPSVSKPSSYTGVSVIDLLKSKGKATDKASRKKLAESLGMKGYIGTAAENKALISAINSKPELLDKYETVSQPAKTAAKQKTKEANTAASTNNFQRYPGRGTSFELDYNNYEGRPDQATSAPVNYFPPFGTPQPKTAKAAAKQKTAQANEKPIESGWIFDRATGKFNRVENFKLQRDINVISGKSTEGMYNPLVADEKDLKPGELATVPGYYTVSPSGKGIDEHDKKRFKGRMRLLHPIEAYGMPKPNESGMTIYQTHPKAHKNSEFKNYKTQKNYINAMHAVGTHGCIGTNCKDDRDFEEINKIPNSDTLRIFDSRIKEGQDYKKLYTSNKMGGEPCYNCGGMYAQGGMYDDSRGLVNRGPYEGRAIVNAYSHGGYYGNVPQHGNPGTYDGYSGTSSGGQYFGDGGSFIPEYGASAYGQLPQYNMGASYADGGMPPEQAAMQQAQSQQQGPPQGGGMDPQQVMQGIAQMLQQGAKPEQIMQQLVQMGIPQDQAQQMIQQVMQQMQAGQQQGPQEEMTEAPQGMYGGIYDDGGEAGPGTPIVKNVSESTNITRRKINVGKPHKKTFTEYYNEHTTPEERNAKITADKASMMGVPLSKRAIVNKYGGPVNPYAQGGLVKGSVHDISEEDIQHLINQGYKIQYI